MITYLIQNADEVCSPIKIGQVDRLENRTKCARDFSHGVHVVGWIPDDIEKDLHRRFQEFKIAAPAGGTEWFRCAPEILQFALQHFLMTPKAAVFARAAIRKREQVASEPDPRWHELASEMCGGTFTVPSASDWNPKALAWWVLEFQPGDSYYDREERNPGCECAALWRKNREQDYTTPYVPRGEWQSSGSGYFDSSRFDAHCLGCRAILVADRLLRRYSHRITGLTDGSTENLIFWRLSGSPDQYAELEAALLDAASFYTPGYPLTAVVDVPGIGLRCVAVKLVRMLHEVCQGPNYVPGDAARVIATGDLRQGWWPRARSIN